jgi:hypothetical protein
VEENAMSIKKYTAAVFALLAVAALSFNADTAGSQSAAGGEDPFNVIHTVTIDRDGRSGPLTTATIPRANFYHAPRDPEPKEDAPRPGAEPRIQPRLE